MWPLLEERRRQWAEEHHLLAERFKTTILGGEWTRQHRGQAFDAVKAFASGALVLAWCAQFQWPKQASFSFAKFGDAVASALAVYWCERSEYFYRLAELADDPAFEYSEEAKQGAPEPTRVSAVLEQAPSLQAATARLEAIRRLVPARLA